MANKKSEKNKNGNINDTNIDVESTINVEEIKKEIVEYAENSVNSKIDDLVKRADRRIISSKNKSIFKRNIVIIILLSLSGFLTYLLYNEGYFDKFFNHNNNENNIVIKEDNINNEVVKEEEKENELDILKKEYSNLLNVLNISENSNYLEDLYNGKLTNKMKLSIALANKLDKVEKDDDMYIINSNLIEEEYAKIFNNDSFKNTSFVLNEINVKYLKVGSIYILEKLPVINTNIKREITGINKSDTEVKITVIEGLVKDNKLYNVLTKELVNEENINLINNSKKLNKVTYVFTLENDKYVLSSVEV